MAERPDQGLVDTIVRSIDWTPTIMVVRRPGEGLEQARTRTERETIVRMVLAVAVDIALADVAGLGDDVELDEDLFIAAEAPGVLWMAMRYALGRSTYAVQEVCDAIAKHVDALRPAQRVRMAEEIEQKLAAGDGGMDMDVRSWRAAAAVLRGAKSDG